MSDKDPTRAPFAAWAVLRPIAVARLGAAQVAEIESYWLDPARALAEPQAQAASMLRMAEALRAAPMDGSELAALVEKLPVLAASMPHQTAPSLATRAIHQIVVAATARDAAAVGLIVAPFRAPDAASRWIPSASDGVLTPKYGFERHAAFIARFLAKNAESVYKPMLRAALELTWLAAGDTKQSKNTLGGIVDQCENAWPADVVRALVDRRLLVIRNSEAHQHTCFNSANETVTFINENDARSTTLELSSSDLATTTAELTALCASIYTGLVRA